MIRTTPLLLALAACSGTPARRDPGYPRAMVIPQPEEQVSFEVDGVEWVRYHYGDRTPKPYFYPVVGPAGHPVTRLTHPHDPFTHAHHLSLWIGHQNVGGLNFWEHMRSPARIVPDRIARIADGDAASLVIHAKWVDGDRKPVLLDERKWTLAPRFETIGTHGHGEFVLDLELKLTPVAPALVLGKTHFGLVSVRVAKMMGTIDGGGTIRNSEGQVNEAQLMPHKRARWCDYSGRAAPTGEVAGITLMDHPANPNHPTYFHVRGDGWMGSSFTEEADVEVRKDKPLVLRYRFWIHRGLPDAATIDAEWRRWTVEP